ncbi:hypothetical protein MMH89_00145 [Candidatus Comchoanobacter bicostacola]|uniref:Uncharacterized protein n=1 Tax=Candidatus Comchoanobacter bicostacola TaxID=2919598 RepID=A0ABY5DJY1_9GAMM|nr:hypothetical protein [Candidatus Comchoanobacter bicostacola]UTC24576.1 hypothetical protein MMH89_00145 [Candidatus Comchoanobacter bicostacola]
MDGDLIRKKRTGDDFWEHLEEELDDFSMGASTFKHIAGEISQSLLTHLELEHFYQLVSYALTCYIKKPTGKAEIGFLQQVYIAAVICNDWKDLEKRKAFNLIGKVFTVVSIDSSQRYWFLLLKDVVGGHIEGMEPHLVRGLFEVAHAELGKYRRSHALGWLKKFSFYRCEDLLVSEGNILELCITLDQERIDADALDDCLAPLLLLQIKNLGFEFFQKRDRYKLLVTISKLALLSNSPYKPVLQMVLQGPLREHTGLQIKALLKDSYVCFLQQVTAVLHTEALMCLTPTLVDQGFFYLEMSDFRLLDEEAHRMWVLNLLLLAKEVNCPKILEQIYGCGVFSNGQMLGELLTDERLLFVLLSIKGRCALGAVSKCADRLSVDRFLYVIHHCTPTLRQLFGVAGEKPLGYEQLETCIALAFSTVEKWTSEVYENVLFLSKGAVFNMINWMMTFNKVDYMSKLSWNFLKLDLLSAMVRKDALSAFSLLHMQQYVLNLSITSHFNELKVEDVAYWFTTIYKEVSFPEVLIALSVKHPSWLGVGIKWAKSLGEYAAGHEDFLEVATHYNKGLLAQGCEHVESLKIRL